MGLNTRLIKRISKTSAADVMHSSGYAQVSNSGNFGAADSTSFAERRKIEQNRKLVQGYKNARLAAGTKMMPKARSIEEQRAILALEIAAAAAQRGVSRQEFNSQVEKGGLRKYDTRQQNLGSINRTARGGDARAARAARFDAAARPTPKTGGFGR